MPELERGLKAYFSFYAQERLYQLMRCQTPAEVDRAGREEVPEKES